MRKLTPLLILSALIFFGPFTHAQSPAPTPPITWTVQAIGCPAPSALPATLAPQFTTAATGITDAGELALITSQQTLVNNAIAKFFTANPQTMLMVRVYRLVTFDAHPQNKLEFTVNPIKIPAGATCPTT
jgi:hypothetical protein